MTLRRSSPTISTGCISEPHIIFHDHKATRGRGLLACQDDSPAAILCPSLCLVLSPTPFHSPVQSVSCSGLSCLVLSLTPFHSPVQVVSCSGLSCLGLSLMPFHNHIKSIMRSGILCLIILLLTVKLSKCNDRYTGGADVAIEKSLVNTLYQFTGQQ